MLGARIVGDKAEFQVWAPLCERLTVKFENGREFALQRAADGVFSGSAPARVGDRYFLVPQSPNNSHNLAVPDPVSRLLPEGVHGPTEIIDPEGFRWTDQNWRGLSYDQYILY